MSYAMATLSIQAPVVEKEKLTTLVRRAAEENRKAGSVLDKRRYCIDHSVLCGNLPRVRSVGWTWPT